jgi:hypothetical protein
MLQFLCFSSQIISEKNEREKNVYALFFRILTLKIVVLNLSFLQNLFYLIKSNIVIK